MPGFAGWKARDGAISAAMNKQNFLLFQSYNWLIKNDD
jgi:hypothetical protein